MARLQRLRASHRPFHAPGRIGRQRRCSSCSQPSMPRATRGCARRIIGATTLAEALETARSGPAVAALATQSARALAWDYAEGRIRHRERFDWHIDHLAIAPTTLEDDLARAVNQPARSTAYLQWTAAKGCPLYRAACGVARHAGRRRWSRRPYPRLDGALALDAAHARRRLCLGQRPHLSPLALSRATRWWRRTTSWSGRRTRRRPMLRANVGSIIVNPWWTLPPTVLREGKARRSRRRAAMCSARRSTARPTDPPEARPDQRARPGQDRHAQSLCHLSARHAGQRGVRQDGSRAQPRLHPGEGHRQSGRTPDRPRRYRHGAGELHDPDLRDRQRILPSISSISPPRPTPTARSDAARSLRSRRRGDRCARRARDGAAPIVTQAASASIRLGGTPCV